jgi:serine/threonine protein kinase/Tol biopolymer transport system component
VIGKTVSHYRILEKLGGGGMGVVYKAEDTKLGRTVALKVLPPERVADPNRKRRFVQEARAASALNHPNIIVIHDIDEAEGVHYIAMECVEGKTLDRLIARHGLRVNEALKYAVQMAAALAKAHSAGIVHRDLKPTNVMVTDDGLVKVLDFGLAKLTEAAPTGDAETAVTLEPTTEEGMIVGTVGYMSPEQAEGKAVDARSDVFSFGSVLYEMLTGQRAFQGETKVSTIAAILREEPKPLSQVVEGLPREVERIVKRCLRKDPAHRFQHMDDLKVALEELKEESDSGELATTSILERKRFPRTALVTIVALAVATIGAALAYWLTRPLPPPRILSSVQITDDGRPKFGALVTDGSRVYFNEDLGGPRGIAQVSAAGGETVPVSALEPGYELLDISPNRAELLVGFRGLLEGPFWLVPTLGGSPRRLGDLVGLDATFSPDGLKILYTKSGGLFLARSDGTESRKLVSVAGNPMWPRWSPDGTLLRFTLQDTGTGLTSLWEVSADGANLHPLLPGWSNPPDECCGNWTPDGKHFVFQSSRTGLSTIWAIREKAGLLGKASREPIQLTAGPIGTGSPVPATDGKKLFVLGGQARGQLLRYDAKSRQFAPYLGGISATGVDFSRDGQWVAYLAYPEGSLWRSKADGSQRLQLTSPPMRPQLPRWSPDEKRIVFYSQTTGRPYKIYIVSAEGGTPQQQMPGERHEHDPGWSPDGNSLVFGRHPSLEDATGGHVAIHLFDLRTHQISTLPGSEGYWAARWSPDGRYIAALEGDTGLVLFDFTTNKWVELLKALVGYPNWSRDGKWVYGNLFSESPGAVIRVRISDRKVERVVSMKDLQGSPTGFAWWWSGLAPDDSPLVLRDTSVQEVYALEWEGP